MKKDKIIYYVATGLLTALMLMSVGMYLFDYETVSTTFEKLKYPTYIIYPLAVAKLIGLYAIWQSKLKTLKEWAYAGFFFNLILAFFAHVMISDNEQWGALAGVVLLLVSYYFGKKVLKN